MICSFLSLILSGSGKTAAFLIPMFERLKTHSAKVRHNQRNLKKKLKPFIPLVQKKILIVMSRMRGNSPLSLTHVHASLFQN